MGRSAWMVSLALVGMSCTDRMAVQASPEPEALAEPVSDGVVASKPSAETKRDGDGWGPAAAMPTDGAVGGRPIVPGRYVGGDKAKEADGPSAPPAEVSAMTELAEGEARPVEEERSSRARPMKSTASSFGTAAPVKGEPADPSMGADDEGVAWVNERKRSEYGDDDRRGDRVVDAPPPPERQSPLRAGTTNDNADYNAFLTFLGTWTDRPGMDGTYDRLDVRDRGTIRVTDAQGAPVANAEVTLRADDVIVHTSRTYGDGVAQVYPHLSMSGDAPIPTGAWTVTVRMGDMMQDVAYTGGHVSVTLSKPVPMPAAVPIDVAFVLDTTGSMSDEIDRIKETLLATTDRLQRLGRPVDLRLGAVYYRDRGDEYVTRSAPFTTDLVAFDASLRQVGAGGGGDTPESLNQGLSDAVNGLSWREGAAKVAFLIADAPPHMDYAQDRTYGQGAMDALAKGIRVHTVAASGLDPVGSLVFRQIAQLTQGRFIFIQYGAMVASASAHGVSGEQIPSNNLDQILFDRVRDEVLTWRK